MWASPAGDYIIGQLLDGTTIKGQAQPGELLPNVAYKFFGRWQQSNNPKYPAPSFLFVAAVKDIPHNREAVVQYIVRSLKGFNTGIGEVKAHKLYDFYEADAVRQLRMNPSEVAVALRHDVSKCREASEILDRDKKFEDCKISLVEMFAGKGFGKKTIAEAIEKWGVRAASFVRRDPYLLLTNRINGAGFSRCDNLYLHLGGAPEKMKRQVLAGAEVMHKDMSGNTWHPISKAVDSIKAKVDGVNIDPAKAIKIGGKTKRFAFYLDDRFRTWISSHEHARSEDDIARIVADLLSRRPEWPDVSNVADISLSPHQRERVAAALRGRVSILKGGPGCGKTFCAAAIVKTVVSQFGLGQILLSASTGNAAVRLSTSMAKNGIPIRATTIHRMLAPNDLGYGTGNWNFSRNESYPLDAKFIVTDEGSMDDTDLMAALLRAVPKDGHLLIIGDENQLPPVGHGSPLRDMIDAGVPFGHLTEVMRQGNPGLIIESYKRILASQPIITCRKFNDATGDNLLHIPTNSEAATFREIEQLYRGIIGSGRYDVLAETQVITPKNDSRIALNTILQGIINPAGATAEGCVYKSKDPVRVGDKVICRDNNSYPDAEHQSIKWQVNNGEFGRIIHVEPSLFNVEFPDIGDGPRCVRIPMKSEYWNEIHLGYAITFHSSQGNEWKLSIAIADESANRMGTRELWVTGITRSSYRGIVVGSLATVAKQCRRVALRERKTFLVEKLKPLIDGLGPIQNRPPESKRPHESMTPMETTTG